MANSVYDPESGETPVHHTTPAGDVSDPRAELKGAEQQSGLYNPGGDSSDVGGKSASPGALAGAEAATALPGEQLGSGFNATDVVSPGDRLKALFMNNRRKAAIGGAAGGGIVGIIVAAFLTLIPLKIEHMVSNLQSHFFANSEQATKKETEKLLTKYIENHVIPGYRSCGTTIKRGCRATNLSGSNPVTNLYKSWSQARLENTLAEKYGIEFQHRADGKWYLKAPGAGANGAEIGRNGEKLDAEFNKSSRAEMRGVVSTAMESETKWKQVMYRYKVGRLLEEKYGIKRCIIFCGVKDTLADKKTDKKLAAQIFLTQRVLIPRTETFGIVMDCLLNPDCHPEKTQPTTGDPKTAELAGEPGNAEVDGAVQTKLSELAASYGITDTATVDKMIQDYKTISEGGGYKKYLVDKVLEKFGLSSLSDPLAKAGPIAAGVLFAARAIDGLNNADGKVRKLTYVTNAAAAVSVYQMYRTYADEIHTGHVDPTEIGSLVNSLGPGNRGSSKDPEIGGSATAESTPLYSNLNGASSSGSVATSIFNSLMPVTAYAASTSDNSLVSSSNYRCKNDKPVPSGQTVCREEVLGQGNGTLSSIHDFLNSPLIAPITTAAGIINAAQKGVVGVINDLTGGLLTDVSNAIGGLISGIPGVSDIFSLFTSFMSSLVKDAIPNPFGSNMSGGRTYDMMAAGANVAGNDACSQIGCQAVSPKTVASIMQQQQTEAQQQFSHQPIFARMFSADSQYSLVSKLAMATPLNMQTSAENSLANIMSNPMGAIANSFGSLFSFGRASAATPNNVDPFNIGTAAFPEQKMPADPEAYWDANNCGDTSPNGPIAKWQQAAASDPVNPGTGMPVHKDVSPCLLIQNSVGAAGGAYDASNLSQDDLADLNGKAAGGNTTTATAKGYFTTTGNHITGPSGKEFIPYGISIVDDLDEPDWKNHAAESDAQIQAAADYWHSNTIRLQVSEKVINGNDAAMQRLKAEVDHIESLGKVPIINDNLEQSDRFQTAPTTRTVDFWKNVTTYFAANNGDGKYANIIFDIFNEPKKIDWSTWQKGGSQYVGMQDVVNAIRSGQNSLNNNLVMIEGPNIAGTLSELDSYPISGNNIAFAYHHVDFTGSPNNWQKNMGLQLKNKVPIIDGEWAQYVAFPYRPECLPNAPKHVSNYLDVLHTNHIGLLFWSLEPGVGIQSSQPPITVDRLDAFQFPTTASEYSQPNSFNGSYNCHDKNDQGKGAGADIMSYFQKYSS